MLCGAVNFYMTLISATGSDSGEGDVLEQPVIAMPSKIKIQVFFISYQRLSLQRISEINISSSGKYLSPLTFKTL
jgi:hypothetical protein